MIAEQIVEAIRITPLHPGDRLPPETELARQLGVGRTSVREALRKLQTLGLVEVIRGRGAFVTEPAGDDAERAFAKWSVDHEVAIEDLLEARLALECMNAGLAAARASSEDRRNLQRLNNEHIEAGANGDLDRALKTDQQFHEAIADAATNPLLSKLHSMLAPELAHFRQMTLAVPRVARRSGLAHQRIVDSIVADDVSGARTAMRDHLWVLYEDVAAANGESDSPSRRPDRSIPIEALGN